MMFLRAVMCLLMMMALPVPGSAQVQGPLSAIDLQNLCNSRYDVDVGMCAGYIMAIAEQLQAQSDPAQPVCLSPAVRGQALVDNMQRAWAEQPPGPHDQAAAHVARVLRARFRCP